MRIKITKKGFLLLLLLPLPRFLRLLRDRHCEDCAPSSKSVNSHTRVRAKYSRELPVAWTEVARFTAERGGGTLKINGARGQRGRSRWFDVPTVFTRKQTRECCHFEIFPKILNVHISLAEYAPNGALLDSTRSIISLSLFFHFPRNFIFTIWKKCHEGNRSFPFPFFSPIKGWKRWSRWRGTRYSAIPRRYEMHTCSCTAQKSRRRAATQAAVKRINTQWDSFVPRLPRSRGLVSLLSLFKARSIPTDIGLPGVRKFSFHLSSPHQFFKNRFERKISSLPFFFFPPPRFVKIRLAINDVIRIIVKFLPIFLSNKWILNNRGREKKRRKSERVSKRDIQVW